MPRANWWVGFSFGLFLSLISVNAWAGDMLYWTDTTDDVIRRSNLDGTGVEVVIDNLNAPSGLALDTTNEWIYWTELGSTAVPLSGRK